MCYLKVFVSGLATVDAVFIVTAEVDKHAKETLTVQSIASRFRLLSDVDSDFPVGHELADTPSRQNGRLIANIVQNFTTIQINQHALCVINTLVE